MIKKLSANDFSWKKSRYGFALFFFFSLLLACSVLRVVLFLKFGRQGTPALGQVVLTFATGLHRDLAASLAITLPLLFWLWLFSNALFSSRGFRFIFIFGFFVFWLAQIFLFFTEYYFFEEFKSRFNTVAVDYLLYPTEVVGNIHDSYPLYRVLALCTGLSLAWAALAFFRFRHMWFQSATTRSRFFHLVSGVVLCGAVWLTLNPQEIRTLSRFTWNSWYSWFLTSLQPAHLSTDRTLNEIGDNGTLSFLSAALTRNLDYAAYYRTLPRDDAYARVRKILAAPGAEFVGDDYSIRRKIAGDPKRPKLNVIILLEESLGSEFWGCLGRTNTLTPQMDQLATTEGLLFANIYACGNRTVRGFEGVFSSFPPLPGDSIVKRDRSENVESIARVLKRDGYSTVFLYGGRGIFDGMRGYAMDNGWDRFLEHNPPFHDDFTNATFSTIWGVCDEEVYTRAIEEFKKLDASGKPFLGTILTVSNHKPYTFPPGRISEDPDKPKPSRFKAVKYTDWCLGRFFDKVKDQPFWTNTIFVVVADHGARVYGKQEIPIHSYEIPWVILGPAAVKQAQRINTLGNSLDVSPTILGLIGRPYESMFFGRDLLHEPADGARALLNHNRDVGLFSHDRMVVLGLQNTVEYYEGDPKATELKPATEIKSDFQELEKNATAIYQVADELYMKRLYRVDGLSVTNVPPPPPAVPRESPATNGPPANAPKPDRSGAARRVIAGSCL